MQQELQPLFRVEQTSVRHYIDPGWKICSFNIENVLYNFVDYEWNKECIGFVIMCAQFFFCVCVHDFDQKDCSDLYKHDTFLIGNLVGRNTQ